MGGGGGGGGENSLAIHEIYVKLLNRRIILFDFKINTICQPRL